MAFTSFDLLLECYKRLGQLTVGVVDSGSTSTVVDAMQSSQYNRGVKTDCYNGGGLFLIEDSALTGVAPQGEFSQLTAFATDTGTFTFDAISTAPAAGDKYGFTTTLFPFLDAIEHANSALKVIGDVETVDSSTLTTDATHSEYPVAVGWKRNVYKVEYQGNTSDDSDNQWIRVDDWEYIPGSAGATGLLITPKLPDSVKLKVSYMGLHSRLAVHDDEIDESIDPEFAVQATIVQMLEAFVSRLGDGAMDTIWPQRLNAHEIKMQKMEMTRYPPKHKRKGRTWIASDNSGSTDNDDMEIYLA